MSIAYLCNENFIDCWIQTLLKDKSVKTSEVFSSQIEQEMERNNQVCCHSIELHDSDTESEKDARESLVSLNVWFTNIKFTFVARPKIVSVVVAFLN